MSTIANIINLKVRTRHSSDHAFNIAGIIDTTNTSIASLGVSAAVYDVRSTLYPLLTQQEVDGAERPTGWLVYDSAKLREILLPVSAFALSNEAMAADLDQAILRRQTQFLTRNQFITQIQALVQVTYPDKVNKLNQLLTLAEQHFQALHTVYNPPRGAPAGVTSPKVVMATRVSGMGTRHEETTHLMEGGNEKQTHNSTSSTYMTKFDPATNAWVDVKDPSAIALSQETVSVSENDELRHPNLENQIRHQRVTVDLLDEILSESIFGLTVPNLPKIWANELASTDMDIRRLQVQFIETFLIPRIPGVVTGVFKEAGDNVRAGESVLRIENDLQILLAGQIKCRAALRLGQSCVVETKNVFASDPSVSLALNARIVSIRGYDSESDRWNLILEAQNPVSPHLPIGYDFEPHPDYSKITFA